MFDIGFWEVALIALIGLIVIGPERLPTVARTLGIWAGRARMYMRSLTSELEREVRSDELKRHFQQTRDEVEQVRGDFNKGREEMESSLRRITEDEPDPDPADKPDKQ